jgi:DASH complex subunit DAD4
MMQLNKNLQEINLANMDTELVSQMFKNYQSNVLFHLEGSLPLVNLFCH